MLSLPEPPPGKFAVYRLIIGGMLFAVFTLVSMLVVFPRGMMSFATGLVEWANVSLLRQVVAILLVVAFGVVMWSYRETQPLSYGALECGFAIQLAWFVLGHPPSSQGTTFATLLGAVYILVRGLDNCKQGWRALKEEEAAAARRKEAPVKTP